MCSLTGFEPNSSAQASKTGDVTKSGQDMSVVLVLFSGSISTCVHQVFDELLIQDQMMIDLSFSVSSLCDIQAFERTGAINGQSFQVEGRDTIQVFRKTTSESGQKGSRCKGA